MRTKTASWLTLFFFCVVVLAECFLNGRSMRTGQKRSVNMITPTEILTKRTCELFQDWSWSKWYERQRIPSSLSILHEKDAYQKRATIWSEWNISSSWEKHLLQCDSVLIPLKSIPQEEYIVLSYNIRASTRWTPFDDGILSCQKGVAFHDHPETWLKEAVFCSVPQPVTVCYKLKTYQDGLHCARDRWKISIISFKL